MGSKKEGGPKTRAQSTATLPPFNDDQLVLSVIAAMKEPDVVEHLKEAARSVKEEIADLVVSKLSVVIDKLQQSLAEKDTIIAKLEQRVSDAEKKLDDIEQYSRRTSVRITGIREQSHDNPNEEVKKLFQHLGVSPHVNRVHRVGPIRNDGTSRPILCQFTNYPDRALILSKRSILKNDFPNVYVNEDLTRARSKILYQARCKKRANKIKDCWSADGRICIKDKDNKIHNVTQASELNRW